MLAAIIEKISGQSYDQFVRENLFLPAGMKDTGYLLPNWDKSRLAQGYTDKEKWGTLLDQNWDTDGPYWNLRGNGGIMSTVLDMYTWHLALMNDTVLSKKARKKLFKRHVAEDDSGNWHYGYGWAIATTERDTTLITHNGGNGIFFADFRRYIDEGITFIYATNHADKVTEEMERLIRKQAVNPPALP
jgi:CubicO group peptidase (beta-lactamase class C family)